jgi:ferredoxin-NADP reductase
MINKGSGNGTGITTSAIPGSSSDTRVTESQAPAGGWRQAIVREIEHPAPHAVLLRLEVADRIDHLPGQHYVIRLTAPDGYVAQRSYSLSSPPSDPLIELYVERLPDGEVSTFLADVVQVGDELHVRGPIGGWFVWRGDTPATGVAGGSGIVPLIAMLRHARHIGRPELLQLAVSARTLAELPYAEELTAAGAHVALTREDGIGRPRGRLTVVDLAPVTAPDATYFVCGSTAFAEAASMLLMDVGVDSANIRVERFGPTG